MSGFEHYQRAAQIAEAVTSLPDLPPDDLTRNIALAQVHATLALTAAVAALTRAATGEVELAAAP